MRQDYKVGIYGGTGTKPENCNPIASVGTSVVMTVRVDAKKSPKEGGKREIESLRVWFAINADTLRECTASNS